ncbi:DUF6660 family protein [Mucilaginibacter terrae]|uniref:DUF6660 family protein n=1 Tax=Mucilaginibacter terrae TaxID=1955052 RepID=UPI0036369DC4
MKYVAAIFSFYFILLAVMPCQDKDDMGVILRNQASVQTEQSSANNAHQEACAPFCICSCCSTPRHIPLQQVFTLFTQPCAQSFAEQKIPATQQQSLDIWQPPQLG